MYGRPNVLLTTLSARQIPPHPSPMRSRQTQRRLGENSRCAQKRGCIISPVQVGVLVVYYLGDYTFCSRWQMAMAISMDYI